MNANTKRQKTYNCDWCQKSGAIKNRVCFWFGGEVQVLKFKNTVRIDNIKYVEQGQIDKVDTEQFLERWVDPICDALPDMSTLDVMFAYFDAVCPKSFITNEIDEILEMEMFCREYSVPPLGANIPYEDYPYTIIDAFGIIRCAKERAKIREYNNMKNTGNK